MARVSWGAARGVRVHWRHHPSHRNVVGGAGGAPGVAFCDAPRTLSQTAFSRGRAFPALLASSDAKETSESVL